MDFKVIIDLLKGQPSPSGRPLTGREQLALSTYGDVLANLFAEGLQEYHDETVERVANQVRTEDCGYQRITGVCLYWCGLTIDADNTQGLQKN